MLKRLMAFALLCWALPVFAQGGIPITRANISDVVPVGFRPPGLNDLNENGRYALLMEDTTMFSYTASVIDQETGAVLMEATPNTSYQTRFLSGDRLALFRVVDTAAPRIYQLPDMTELYRLPLTLNPMWREGGDGYFYKVGTTAYWQPGNFSTVAISISQNMVGEYLYGKIAESPDGRTVAVANEYAIELFDLEAREQVGQIGYPLGSDITFSTDGTRLSALTNEGKNWLAYDLGEERVLGELYAPMMAGGTISPSGRYGVGLQQVTYSNIGTMRVYHLDSGEELTRVDTIGFTTVQFIDETLTFVRDYDGESGEVTFYDPAADRLLETELTTSPTAGAPVRRLTSDMLVVTTPALLPGDLGALSNVITLNSGEILRQFPGYVYASADDELTMSRLIYAVPTTERPALVRLSGRTRSNGINVRAMPSVNAERVTGAAGEVSIVARSTDGLWLYLDSHIGWVSADLIAVEGEIETLAVMPE